MRAMLTAKRKVAAAAVVAGMLAAGAGLVVPRAMEAGAAEAEVGPPKQAGTSGLGTLRIESTPSGAKVFIRTGGHNGYAEVGKTPVTLRDIEPGLLEYTLLRTDCQLYDGSLWLEPGREHVERVRMKPGRVFFVDQKHPEAADTNPGSEGRPWATIPKAATVLKAGDTALIKEGSYEGPKRAGQRTGGEFNPVNSGEPGRPIVFRAYPGHRVVVKGQAGKATFLITRRRHVVLDGFRVEGHRVGAKGSEHVTIRNIELVRGEPEAITHPNNLHWGLILYEAKNCRLENNYVHSMIHPAQPPQHNSACIMLFAGTEGCVIQNNEADAGRDTGKGVFNAFGQKGGHIFGNIWRRNVARSAVCGFLGMAATACDESSGDNIYYYNLCIDCRNAFELNHMCSGFRIFNNTVWNCDRFLIGGDRCERNRCWNNIAVVRLGYSTGRWPIERLFAFCDYNLLWRGKVARHRWRPYAEDLAAWRARTGFGGRSVAADPLFVDAEGGDFHLQGGSPAVDAGRPLARAVGSGRDSDLLEVTNEGSYVHVVRLVRGKHGAAPPEDRPLRSPFEPGDLVQIGAGEGARRARVVEVVDRTHLRLDRRISWTEGEWVTFPFVGEAPDIGAYEYGDERRVIGPTWKHYPKRDFSKKGKTDS